MTELTDLLYSFEAEHVFAQSLYKDAEMRAFLESRGYNKHMLGNLKGVYNNQATVDFIQNLPDGHPLKSLLLDSRSGFSINWHRGGPTSIGAGGFQLDKNRFTREQIRLIMDSGASEEAKTRALNNLFDFTSRWVEGKVTGPDGKPLPIMGDNNGLYDQVNDIWCPSSEHLAQLAA